MEKAFYEHYGGRQYKLEYHITQDDAGVYSASLLRVSSRAAKTDPFTPEVEDLPRRGDYERDLTRWLNGDRQQAQERMKEQAA